MSLAKWREVTLRFVQHPHLPKIIATLLRSQRRAFRLPMCLRAIMHDVLEPFGKAPLGWAACHRAKHTAIATNLFPPAQQSLPPCPGEDHWASCCSCFARCVAPGAGRSDTFHPRWPATLAAATAHPPRVRAQIQSRIPLTWLLRASRSPLPQSEQHVQRTAHVPCRRQEKRAYAQCARGVMGAGRR